MPTTTEPLPEYAGAVAACGDPQPVIDELTTWLQQQTAPQIPIPTEPDETAEDEPDETSEVEQ